MGHFNWFGWISSSVNEDNLHVVTAAFVAGLLVLLSFLYKASLKSAEEEVLVTGRFSFKNVFQVTV